MAARPPAFPLRRILQALDALLVYSAWLLALSVGDHGLTLPLRLGLAGAITVIGMLSLATQHLYETRICSVPSLETVRLSRVAAFLGLVAAALSGATRLRVSAALIGTVATFVLLRLGRSAYVAWLRGRRRDGRFVRPVIVVGANDEAEYLCELFRDHPELGMHVVGVVGRPDEYAQHQRFGAPLLGPATDAVAAAGAVGATGVIVAATAVEGNELQALTRPTADHGLHIHVSTGLQRVDHRRLRIHRFAHEPLFYLEQPVIAAWKMHVKRAVDIMLASIGLVLVAPVMAIAAAAIRLDDHGPVLFRQVRAGRKGRHFEVLKFRTMVRDAEDRIDELQAQNEREGPLFKVTADPRVTRVGNFLRASSIDELPQLINVLRGDMSLVGPRPALPAEVADFDDELLGRLNATPGITGLWQVEARDNPSFSAYRRLDLFYVENWSLTLDLVILVRSFGAVAWRAVRAVFGSRPDTVPALD